MGEREDVRLKLLVVELSNKKSVCVKEIDQNLTSVTFLLAVGFSQQILPEIAIYIKKSFTIRPGIAMEHIEDIDSVISILSHNDSSKHSRFWFIFDLSRWGMKAVLAQQIILYLRSLSLFQIWLCDPSQSWDLCQNNWERAACINQGQLAYAC